MHIKDMAKKDSFITDITDSGELGEIRKIADMLNSDEKVLLVATQSRIKSGGSAFSPNTIYATDRRIILRDPKMLGLKAEIIDIPYNFITNAHVEKGLLSATVTFNAPGLFNPSVSNRIPGIERLHVDERGENGVIDAIPKKKADELVEIIRNGITQIRPNLGFSPATAAAAAATAAGMGNNNNNAEKLSNVEELTKLADLKERGVISEEEFIKMKERILKHD
ncbi:MAG: PH domain-containing protein [Thermoproteota archaeon]|nr:PH domain-containing protein [Thermoproteota archaeon]